jgi:DNA-binding response OmpR family regulator
MTKHRLLLVEDDFDVAEMLLMYFQSIDYEVLHSDTGEEGIELARTRFPHLILLDVMLPDMDGYEICYRLRSMSLTKYIPTLFLTQRDERADKVKGLELGADDYITKPFDIDELRLRVIGAIRRASRENLNEPRTGLPTGSLINEEREKHGSGYDELTFKLHGFNAYSDLYGFMAANDAIHHAGKTIRDVLSELGHNDAFVGIEGDDFIALVKKGDTAQVEKQVARKFNQQVSAFYKLSDSTRGGILLREGEADEEFVPMMSLTAGDPQPVAEKPQEASSDPFEW